jgi:hypothetical protein
MCGCVVTAVVGACSAPSQRGDTHCEQQTNSVALCPTQDQLDVEDGVITAGVLSRRLLYRFLAGSQLHIRLTRDDMLIDR